jgi:hypothetical protein
MRKKLLRACSWQQGQRTPQHEAHNPLESVPVPAWIPQKPPRPAFVRTLARGCVARV